MRHQQASSVHKEYHVTSNRIAASAGTGKTYQLASRYIALLLLGAKPEEIIAITFTRKAAGEFRNRILHALAEGADNKCDTETGRNELAVRVWDALSGLSVKPTEYGPWEVVESTNRIPILPVTEAIVRYAAEQRQYPEEIYNNSSELQSFYQFKPTNAATFAGLLEDMVAVLTRLQLSTIDSFFNSLVSSNCMDLGMTSTTPLDPSEEDSVRTEAIRQYLDEQGKTDESRADFLQMFSSITEGAGNRTQARIESDLAEFIRLYRDIPEASCWGNIDSFNGNADFRLATNEELQQYRETTLSLKTLLITHGPDLQKEKKLSKNAYSQLNELANGGLRVKRDAASVIKKYFSSGPDIPDAEKDILSQIADHANTLAELAVRSKLRLTADRTRNLHKLISGYAKVYDIRMKAEGHLSFDDISRMAQELMNCDNSENQQLRQHIAYRMGGKLKHWMLDEFQDTSESQFRTLIPLLQPIAEDAGSTSINFTVEERLLQMPDCLRDKLTSTNHHVARESLFIVGDTKQSIYGFRTGKTEVFDRLASEEPWKSPLQPSPLNRSFRSSPVIM
ncbi:MAG: UvrD-helicase domain-containing protein, partial [Akkermansia sp.]|nr:UvrD-helicase domain-containing protein [Akkermansia sp.]